MCIKILWLSMKHFWVLLQINSHANRCTTDAINQCQQPVKFKHYYSPAEMNFLHYSPSQVVIIKRFGHKNEKTESKL